MSVRNFQDIGLARVEGRAIDSHFRKVPSQTTVAGMWYDLSMAAGNPVPNYYASSPLTADVLDPYKGLYHGAPQSPAVKYLIESMLCSPSSGFVGMYKLLDYVLYYPFVDFDDSSAQPMDNTVALPRYTDGTHNLRVMLVAVTPSVGGGTFTYDYINQDGEAKTSPTCYCGTTAANIGTLLTTQQAVAANPTYGPFLPMAEGDTSVQQITGVTPIILNGGLGSLVIVKPLADTALYEINNPTEQAYVGYRAGAPEITDGAYLNYIVNTAASVSSGQLTGRLTFVWK